MNASLVKFPGLCKAGKHPEWECRHNCNQGRSCPAVLARRPQMPKSRLTPSKLPHPVRDAFLTNFFYGLGIGIVIAAAIGVMVLQHA